MKEKIAQTSYKGAVCTWRKCPRGGKPAVGLQARRWVVVSIYGFPVGVTGPDEGLEITRPIIFCRWECVMFFSAEAAGVELETPVDN